MHAQYFALYNLNLKLLFCAKESFSLFLILLECHHDTCPRSPLCEHLAMGPCEATNAQVASPPHWTLRPRRTPPCCCPQCWWSSRHPSWCCSSRTRGQTCPLAACLAVGAGERQGWSQLVARWCSWTGSGLPDCSLGTEALQQSRCGTGHPEDADLTILNNILVTYSKLHNLSIHEKFHHAVHHLAGTAPGEAWDVGVQERVSLQDPYGGQQNGVRDCHDRLRKAAVTGHVRLKSKTLYWSYRSREGSYSYLTLSPYSISSARCLRFFFFLYSL
mgnify:FL=1